MRYLAAKLTAGLAVFLVKASNLVPFPPANIIATTLLLFSINIPSIINHTLIKDLLKEINLNLFV